jgi:exodeoxyribonuclease V alpha subunit
MTVAFHVDPHDARRARDAPAPLREFNDAGVLDGADVHVALRLMAIAGEPDASVGLAAALAVRGPRLGHVYVDLETIRDRAAIDADEPVDLSALPWPEVAAWTQALRRSALVADGEDGDAPGRPLRLVGTRLYLDRYWREERRVAADLLALCEAPAPGVRIELLAAGLERLFAGDPDDSQRLAAATATLRRFAVVAGGPGTGKTTTVARILALLAEQAAAAGAPAPLVALAAPTARAAARLEEAVHAEAAGLRIDETVRAGLLALDGSTLHRLLGWRPDSHSRFRHDRANRLAHDVVVVDETSMVSLSLMGRLVEAVRPGARLILVGDPGQLTSIEAGAVLGDVVGPAAGGLRMREPARRALERAIGRTVPAREPPPGGSGIGDGIVVLDRSHRFGTGIAVLAQAVRGGDADATVAALRDHPREVTWIEGDAAQLVRADADGLAALRDHPREVIWIDAAAPPLAHADADGLAALHKGADGLAALRDGAVTAARRVIAAAAAGDAAGAIASIGDFRVLCAHRRGEHGAATWRARVESWLAAAIDGFAAQGAWYVGRPLLVTQNDAGLRLHNGDTGVVIAGGDRAVSVAFERHGELLRLSPSRLGAVETVYATTIHKAQGSQLHTAAVVLPPATSPILTRELLYTAVTRARTRLIVAGSEDAVRAAVGRRVARASGLGPRLWGPGTDT